MHMYTHTHRVWREMVGGWVNRRRGWVVVEGGRKGKGGREGKREGFLFIFFYACVYYFWEGRKDEEEEGKESIGIYNPRRVQFE